MDYIVIRQKWLGAVGRLIFIDAVLVINAEDDADALRAAKEKRPQEKANAWEIIPVLEPVDAAT